MHTAARLARRGSAILHKDKDKEPAGSGEGTGLGGRQENGQGQGDLQHSLLQQQHERKVDAIIPTARSTQARSFLSLLTPASIG